MMWKRFQKRQNIIAAYSKTQGIIAPFVFEGGCNSEIFTNYIRDELCPHLKEGQVVVMETAAFHKSKEIISLIEEKKCKLIFLPPYSPELNPIEHYWSVLKKNVKKIRKKFESLLEAIPMSIYLTRHFNQT